MELWELVARESIRDLVARYNANGDSGRFDAMLALFAEDAVMTVAGQTCAGASEIRTLFEGIASNAASDAGEATRVVRHLTATHQIDVLDRDRARGRAYYLVLTDQGADHWGRYVDEYRRVHDRWLFASRNATVDGLVPGGWGDHSNVGRTARSS